MTHWAPQHLIESEHLHETRLVVIRYHSPVVSFETITSAGFLGRARNRARAWRGGEKHGEVDETASVASDVPGFGIAICCHALEEETSLQGSRDRIATMAPFSARRLRLLQIRLEVNPRISTYCLLVPPRCLQGLLTRAGCKCSPNGPSPKNPLRSRLARTASGKRRQGEQTISPSVPHRLQLAQNSPFLLLVPLLISATG
ncbi:hypothetical protein V2G26_003443 [Clonostachys chloroleuca]